jgi:hypothetical protein
MGMTYDELSVFGRLRKVERLGPMSMWEKLARIWKDERDLNPTEVYAKVRRFFWYFNINRHKMTTLTPVRLLKNIQLCAYFGRTRETANPTKSVSSALESSC